MRRPLLAAAALLLPAAGFRSLHAQAVAPALPPSQNPPGVRWAVIDAPHVRVIFPREIEPEAQRVANTLEGVHAAVARTLRRTPRRIALVLQTRRADANGFVTLAPRRSEWFNTPPQSSDLLGANDWYTLLAVHELRHVVQFDRLDAGLTRVAYWLFGETGWDAMASLAVPGWFWEGDAVGTETALTRSGRGRIPEFDEALRAIRAEGRRDSYQKAMWGSFRDFVPNHYVLGYAITTHVKRRYGPDAWRRVLQRTSVLAPLPNAFSLALRHVTGRSASALYADAMQELDSLWRLRADGESATPVESLRRARPSAWTSDLHPQQAADGRVIALRAGLEDVPQLVAIDPASGAARRLVTLGPRPGDEPFGVGGHLVAWSELRFDPRWRQRSWTVIRTHDLRTGATRTLEPRGRLYAPSVSPDDRRIACVEVGADGRVALVVVDASTGRELRRLADDSATAIQTPRWSTDGRSVVYVRVAPRGGRSIVVREVDGGEPRAVVAATSANVASPSTDGRWVYYQMPRAGRDQLFATEIATGRTMRVATRPIAAVHPSLTWDGRSLLFEDGTAMGGAPARLALDPDAWTPIERVSDAGPRFEDPLVEQEGGPIALDSIPAVRYARRAYAPAAHLVDVHSWFVLADPAARSASAGIVSTDLLGTLATTLDLEYDGNERTLGAGAGASWGGRFPIVDVGLHVGGRSSSYTASDGTLRGEGWTETSASAGLRVPLQLTRSVFATALSLGASVAETRISGREVRGATDPGDGRFAPVTYEAQFGRGYRWIRDINPRWGQLASASYTHTPFGGDFGGTRLATSALLFAPGPLPHHSIWGQLAFERQGVDPRAYRYPMLVRFPRGYASRFSERFALASANYTLPLAYPDLGLLSAIYVKRVRATAFVDWGRGERPTRTELYRSYGVDAGADTYLFHYPIPLFLGARVVRLIDAGRTKVEGIVGLPF